MTQELKSNIKILKEEDFEQFIKTQQEISDYLSHIILIIKSMNKELDRKINENAEVAGREYVQKNEQILLNKSLKIKKCYNCEFCPKIFSGQRQLGGHISRTHQLMSKKSSKRKFIKKDRKIEQLRNEYLKYNLFNK